MTDTVVSQHLRTSERGRTGIVRRHRRFLTTDQIAAGRGQGIGRASFGHGLVVAGLRDGYAATGPWEVERNDGRLTLLHYAFPIARARWNDSVGWEITRVQGRPGFGMSKTDREAVNALVSVLRGRGAQREGIEIPKVGQTPDPRLRGVRGMGSRVSPYAEMRGAVGMANPAYGLGPRFPARRGMKVR